MGSNIDTNVCLSDVPNWRFESISKAKIRPVCPLYNPLKMPICTTTDPVMMHMAWDRTLRLRLFNVASVLPTRMSLRGDHFRCRCCLSPAHLLLCLRDDRRRKLFTLFQTRVSWDSGRETQCSWVADELPIKCFPGRPLFFLLRRRHLRCSVPQQPRSCVTLRPPWTVVWKVVTSHIEPFTLYLHGMGIFRRLVGSKTKPVFRRRLKCIMMEMIAMGVQLEPSRGRDEREQRWIRCGRTSNRIEGPRSPGDENPVEPLHSCTYELWTVHSGPLIVSSLPRHPRKKHPRSYSVSSKVCTLKFDSKIFLFCKVSTIRYLFHFFRFYWFFKRVQKNVSYHNRYWAIFKLRF